MAYLTVTEFAARSCMNPDDVAQLNGDGFVEAKLEDYSSYIWSRLSKRYAPFDSTSVPRIILIWLTDLVTLDCYMRLGFSPSSEQDAQIVAKAEQAKADLLEAANSETGLFGIPLRQDTPGTSGISKGRPIVKHDTSPYDWIRNQRNS